MRCFVAIELPEAVRGALQDLQQRLASLDRAVRWTAPEHIHLTVKFLGEVRDAELARVCQAVSSAVARTRVMELQFQGTGCFPPRGSERIVWAGLPSPPEELLECQRAVEAAVAPLGFPPENRAYSPHLTIGRVRQADRRLNIRGVVREQDAFVAPAFVVRELVVFQSLLGPGGARYVPLARVGLGSG